MQLCYQLRSWTSSSATNYIFDLQLRSLCSLRFFACFDGSERRSRAPSSGRGRPKHRPVLGVLGGLLRRRRLGAGGGWRAGARGERRAAGAGHQLPGTERLLHRGGQPTIALEAPLKGVSFPLFPLHCFLCAVPFPLLPLRRQRLSPVRPFRYLRRTPSRLSPRPSPWNNAQRASASPTGSASPSFTEQPVVLVDLKKVSGWMDGGPTLNPPPRACQPESHSVVSSHLLGPEGFRLVVLAVPCTNTDCNKLLEIADCSADNLPCARPYR